MSSEALEQCFNSIVRVLSLAKGFTKRDEKELKKILRKLSGSELVYLSNLFDMLYEELSARGLAGE